MSNSIWKTPDIKPTNDDDIVFFVGEVAFAGYYEKHLGEFVEHATGECYPVDKWATLDDLIAQADKAERLQKAVDVAKEALKYARQRGLDNTATLFAVGTKADKALDEIRQLIKEQQ